MIPLTPPPSLVILQYNVNKSSVQDKRKVESSIKIWVRKYDLYTDEKRNKISIYQEIQKGAVAKSYMTNGLLIFD